MIRFTFALVLFALALTNSASAGTADVLKAKAKQSNRQTWQVSATIKHGDTGWDHYANGFEVLAPDGRVLATRVLHHPHVNEQPFTRSVSVTIPQEISHITIRATDSVHGSGGAEVTVKLR